MVSMEEIQKKFKVINSEVSKVVIGQEKVVEQLLAALLCNGHAYLEGYPGLAKTLLVKTISNIMDLKFSRIQGTPDLLPSDITGTYVIDESKGKKEFKFQPGPIFANIVLMDEVNRATPKSHSAILEAMQERQVTVGNATYKLEEPFFILATANPIEQEGSLTLDQSVFINNELKTGRELLDEAKKNNTKLLKNGDFDLYKLDNSYTYSLNSDGKLEKSECYLYTLPYDNEIVKVKTRIGREIKVSKNHPFLVNEKGEIKWKKAEELVEGDYMVVPAKIENRKFKISQDVPLFDCILTKKEIYQLTKNNSNNTLQIYNLKYLNGLLTEDVSYDKIELLKRENYNGLIYGLTVPGLQNYVGGSNGGFINHNTFKLSEAQVDRFLFKINVEYPKIEEELEIVSKYTESNPNDIKVKTVFTSEELVKLQYYAKQIPVAKDIIKYAVELINNTRNNKQLIEYGASPRASISIIMAAKARALMSGRKYVSKEDINIMAYPVLRHRIILSFEAERQNMTEDDVIGKLIKK